MHGKSTTYYGIEIELAGMLLVVTIQSQINIVNLHWYDTVVLFLL